MHPLGKAGGVLYMAEQKQSARSQELSHLEIPRHLEEAYLVYHRYRGWFWGFKVVAGIVVLALACSTLVIIRGHLSLLLLVSGIGLIALAVAGVVRQWLSAVARVFGGWSILKKRVALYLVMLRYEECRERLGSRQGENDMSYNKMRLGFDFLQYAQDALQKHQPTFGHYLRLGEGCIKEVERGFLG